jgi:hypothetical protein
MRAAHRESGGQTAGIELLEHEGPVKHVGLAL